MNLCVIPARGGSKRIPRKNIKHFLGKPIIAYSIQAAVDSGCFDKVIVSTDDEEIANVARQNGAEVPFIRPEELSNDYAGTLPVVKHAIEWFENHFTRPGNVCCLYATAPFVQADLLKQSFQQWQKSQADYCFSVTNFASPIQRAFKFIDTSNGNKTQYFERLEMFNPEMFSVRSQDLTEAFHDAGQFYWGRSEAFTSLKPLFSEYSYPFVLPSYLVQDIDTLEDWHRAELMYQVLQKNGDIL